MLRYLILFFLAGLVQLLSFLPLYAQSFVEVNPGLFKPSSLGYTSWCDVNNDGYTDLFLTGFNLVPDGGGGYIDFDNSIIYINDRMGSFTESNIKNIPRLIYGGSAWGDFNNDGWADLAITGTTSGFASDGRMQLFINDHGETFTKLNVELPDILEGKILWFDYNNDGWQDLFMMGFDTSGKLISRMFQNQHGVNFLDTEIKFDVKTNGGQTNFQRIDAVVGDFDNDMDRDIIVAQTSSAGASVDLYENTQGTFVKKVAGLPQIAYGTMAIADFNADGNFDIVVNGTAEHSVYETYINKATFSVLIGDGHLNFSELKTFTNQGSYWGSVSAGDVNSDGLPDIVVNGTGNGSARTSVFINTNGNDFTLASAGLFGTLFGQATLSDYDNDGDLDMFVIGSLNGSSSTAQAHLYRNISPSINQKPEVPQNVRLVYENAGVKIAWDKSTDDKTDTKSISYNVRVGTTPNGGEIISGLTNTSSLRQVDSHGNVDFSNAIKLVELPEMFYYQVQAIDAAYHESEFSPLQTGCILAAPDITYKEKYCYKEKLELAGADIEIYEDEELKTLIYSGSKFIAEAMASKTLYVVSKNSNGCFRIPAVVSVQVSDEPTLQLLVNDEPTTISDTIVLSRCYPDQVFKLGLQTNYSHVELLTEEVAGEIIYMRYPGMVYMKIHDGLGCASEYQVSVRINEFADGFIPNVITPNGDGRNDYFQLADFKGTEVSILNRHGSTVYQSMNYNGGFDGHSLSSGVYYYQVAIPACNDVKKGSLHIIH